DRPLVGERVLRVEHEVHAVAHADDVRRVPLAGARADVDQHGRRATREQLAVTGDDRQGGEAAGAVGLEADVLPLQGRHAGGRDRLHRAAGEGVEAAVDVHLDLARIARERLKLQDARVLGRLVDGADEAEVQLAVGREEPVAVEAGRLVRGAEVRAGPVGAPVLVEELADAERVVAEAKLGDILRHGASYSAGSRIDLNPDGACGPSAICSRMPTPSRLPMRARHTCWTW